MLQHALGLMCLSITLLCGVVHADVTTGVKNVGWNGEGMGLSHYPHETVGWEFSVGEAIVVTELGYYDYGLDGLLTFHDVGIWDDSGNLLASALLNRGDDATLRGDYRFVAIDPVVLEPGTAYIVGATVPVWLMSPNYPDPDFYPNSSRGIDFDLLEMDPTVTLLRPNLQSPSDGVMDWTLTCPTEVVPSYETTIYLNSPETETIHTYHMAPNFSFVPEPSTVTLLLGGGLLVRGKRKK